MTVESHPPLEEYLETIWYLAEDGVEIMPARLAQRLGRALPTVMQRLDRLVDDGYLIRPEGKEFSFTPLGRSYAKGVVRKHRLAECLLYDVIGLSFAKLHLEAGRWEHAISDEVEILITKLVNHPARCPHGNVIPYGDNPLFVPPPTEMRLAEGEPGTRLRIKRITEELEEDEPLMATLVLHGVLPGSEIVVDHKDVTSITILHRDTSITLNARAAQLLVVDRS